MYWRHVRLSGRWGVCTCGGKKPGALRALERFEVGGGMKKVLFEVERGMKKLLKAEIPYKSLL